MNYLYVLIVLAGIIFWIYRIEKTNIFNIFRTSKKSYSKTPEDLKVPFETVYMKTDDGADISCWFIESKNTSNTTIIITPPIDKTKADILDDTIFLYEKYNLLYVDFRTYGESKGKFFSFGLYEHRDLKSAFEFLKNFRTQYSNNIIYLGHDFSSFLIPKISNLDFIKMIFINPIIDYFSFIKSYIFKKTGLFYIFNFIIKRALMTKDINLNLLNLEIEINSEIVLVYYENKWLEKKDFDMFYEHIKSDNKKKIIIKDLSSFKEDLNNFI